MALWKWGGGCLALIAYLGTVNLTAMNKHEIWMKIQNLFFKDIHLKMSHFAQAS